MHLLRNAPCRLRLTILIVALGAAGCTTSALETRVEEKPTEEYRVVAVGSVVAQETRWDYLVPQFRHAFVTRLKEKQNFESVLDPAPSDLPASTVLFTGKLTEIDRGSKVARVIIGFGAGRARVEGDFEIRDQDGKLLASFNAAKAYSGGAGIGGWDMVDMVELIEQLGTETADRLIGWSKGLGLAPPAPQ